MNIQQNSNEVSDDWKQDFGKKFGFVNNKFTEREMWIIDNVVNKSNTFNEPITDQEIDAEIERYIKQFWPRPEHGGAVRLGFKRAVRWMQERKAIPINFEDDIDTVGNCANCGVEFHIHKQSEEPINNEELKEKFKSVIIEEYGNLVLNSLVKKCVQVAEQYAASKLNKSVVISKHIAKDFFNAGYDYRSSLTPDSIEIFGKNAQPDFEDFLKQYNLELKLNNTIEDKWISVEDGLPEEGGRYWCYVEHQTDLGLSHFQWNCSYNETGKTFSDKYLTDGERVTHWQYLPKAPKKVNN